MACVQILLAAKEDKKNSVNVVHKVTYSNDKAKTITFKNAKKLTTKTILHCTPCYVDDLLRYILKLNRSHFFLIKKYH